MKSAKPAPIGSVEELDGADADLVGKQICWEIKRLLDETGKSHSELATDIGYKWSGGGYSAWASSGKDKIPLQRARRLDELFSAVPISLAGETYASLAERQRRRSRPDGKPRQFDVFIAGLMAAVKPEAYGEHRSAALELKEALERYCDLSAYYAGMDIESHEQFDSPALAISATTRALRDSRYFILLALDAPILPSGVYVEAGMALALKKPSIYFVRHTGPEYLPWMLRSIGGHDSTDLPRVHVELVKDVSGAVSLVRRHRTRYFTRLN